MRVALEHRQFTVDEYHRMGEAGILTDDDRLELIDGALVAQSRICPRHAAAVARLTHWFIARVGEQAIVRVQNPILLGEYSEPQPDLALLRPRDDFYAEKLPGPADILLVIEIADTTIAKDRGVKLPLYARHGIAEAWLVDLMTDAVEVHRSPAKDRYTQVERLRGDQLVTCVAFPEISFTAAGVLGR